MLKLHLVNGCRATLPAHFARVNSKRCREAVTCEHIFTSREIGLAGRLWLCHEQHLADIGRRSHLGQARQAVGDVPCVNLELLPCLARTACLRSKLETTHGLVILLTYAQTATHAAHVLGCGVVVGRTHANLVRITEHRGNRCIAEQPHEYVFARQLPLVLDFHEASLGMRQLLRDVVSFATNETTSLSNCLIVRRQCRPRCRLPKPNAS